MSAFPFLTELQKSMSVNDYIDSIPVIPPQYLQPIVQHAKTAEELGISITPLKVFIPGTIEPLIEAIAHAPTPDYAEVLHELAYALIDISGIDHNCKAEYKTLADESLIMVEGRYSKAIRNLFN